MKDSKQSLFIQRIRKQEGRATSQESGVAETDGAQSQVLSGEVCERGYASPFSPAVVSSQGGREFPKSGFPSAVHRSSIGHHSRGSSGSNAARKDQNREADTMEGPCVRPAIARSDEFNDFSDVMEAVHKENLEIINSMTKGDRERELREVAESLDPTLMDFLRQRGDRKYGNEAKDRAHERLPSLTVTIAPGESGKDFGTTPMTFLPPVTQALRVPAAEDLRRYFPNEPTVNEKLLWTVGEESPGAGPGRPNPDTDISRLLNPATRGTRFGLSGSPIPPPLSVTLPSTLALHHHADEPDAAGYTVEELSTLARSKIAPQKALAGKALAGVILWCVERHSNVSGTGAAESAFASITSGHSEAILSDMVFLLSVPALAVSLVADVNRSVAVVGFQLISSIVDAASAWEQTSPSLCVTRLHDVALQLLLADFSCSGRGGDVVAAMEIRRTAESALPPAERRGEYGKIGSSIAFRLLEADNPSLSGSLRSILTSPKPVVEPRRLLKVVHQLAQFQPGFPRDVLASIHDMFLCGNWPTNNMDTAADALMALQVFLLYHWTTDDTKSVITTGIVTTLIRYITVPSVGGKELAHYTCAACLGQLLFSRTRTSGSQLGSFSPLLELISAVHVGISHQAADTAQSRWYNLARESLLWAARKESLQSSTEISITQPFIRELRPLLALALDRLETSFRQAPMIDVSVPVWTSMLAFLGTYFDCLVEPDRDAKERTRKLLMQWVLEEQNWEFVSLQLASSDATHQRHICAFLASALRLSEVIAFKGLPRDRVERVAMSVLAALTVPTGDHVENVARRTTRLLDRPKRAFLTEWLADRFSVINPHRKFLSAYVISGLFLPGEEDIAVLVGQAVITEAVSSIQGFAKEFPSAGAMADLSEDDFLEAYSWLKQADGVLLSDYDWPLRPDFLKDEALEELLHDSRPIQIFLSLLILLERLGQDASGGGFASPWHGQVSTDEKLYSTMRVFLLQTPITITTESGTEHDQEAAFRDDVVSKLLLQSWNETSHLTQITCNVNLFQKLVSAYMQEAFGDRTFCLYLLKTLTCMSAVWWTDFWNSVVEGGMSKWRYAFREVKVKDPEFTSLSASLFSANGNMFYSGGASPSDVLQSVERALATLEDWEVEERGVLPFEDWEALYAVAIDFVARDRLLSANRHEAPKRPFTASVAKEIADYMRLISEEM